MFVVCRLSCVACCLRFVVGSLSFVGSVVRRLLFVLYWLCVCCLLFVDWRLVLFVDLCSLFVVCCSSCFVIHCLSFVVCCLLFVGCCSLFVVGCWL